MEASMLTLSSTREVVRRIEGGAAIFVRAYTLHGLVLAKVEEAARRGADVTVELERHPISNDRGHLAKENKKLVREMDAAGVHASLVRWTHAKVIEVDNSAFFDEKNWHDDDIVLSEDDPVEARSIPMMKDKALALEAGLLTQARARDDAVIESETFGAGNPTYNALKELGEAHASPRLLVSEADLRSTRNERAVLRDLVAHGVRVRTCRDSAKLAAAGNSAWLGSANATYAGGGFDMSDWGVTTKDATIVKTVRDRLEAVWAAGRDFTA
jgi:hypothetical protein